MEVQLSSISPLSFSILKQGDVVEVRKKHPRTNEFRGEKIGGGSVSFLIFKGITKIGMIPTDFVSEHGEAAIKRRCRIKSIDHEIGRISVEM
jgi:hypothetical protein